MNKRRLLLALLAVIMVLSVSIGPALAYFSTYTVAEGKKPIKVVPDTTIDEEVANETQKVVTVTNAGNAPCFVRATAFAPTGVTLGTAGGNGWSAQDGEGFWVYGEVLMPGESTGKLVIPISGIPAAANEGDSLNIAVVYESTTAIWNDSTGEYDIGRWGQDVVPVTLEGGTGA